MLENALNVRKVSKKVQITLKTAISLLIVTLAVVLPQIVHLIAGAQGGVKWLPMYLPVLIGGCLLGAKWGFGIGVLSPAVSFVLTSLFGDPMPAAARLLFMMAELAVFATVSGMFSEKIYKNLWFALPAIVLAQAAGRSVFILSVAVFENVAPFTVSMIWAQVQAGFIGLIVQAATALGIVCLLALALRKENKSE